MTKLLPKLKLTKSRTDSATTSNESISSNNDVCNDRDSNPIERELLKIYDECQSVPAERRSSSSSSKKNKWLAAGGVHSYPCCSDSLSAIPPTPPSKWPQRPILLRPSPDSEMTIIGVRYSTSKEYLPLPAGYCKGCTLPMNNGFEKPGECLVIDFETQLFVGTLLLRVKNISPVFADSPGTVCAPNNEDCYFDKKKRTFQATVKGRFKQAGIPMSECVTGQMFDRPAGDLPPRLLVKGAISVISLLAPQLQARLQGDCPRFLSPLMSTAQTVSVNLLNEKLVVRKCIEDDRYEPQASHQSSLIQTIISSGVGESIGLASTPLDKTPVSSRIKTRKKAFDKIFSHRIKTPSFDVNKEYTFEFFQHLISFDDFCLDFAKPVGKHPMRGMLNGQPLKFMAAHQTIDGEEEAFKWLWCFDIWHESLYEDALLAEDVVENTSSTV